MATHAMLPVPQLHGDHVRLYVTGRNEAGCGQVGCCTLDLSEERFSLVEISPVPLVPTGQPGAFDDHGASASALVEDGGGLFLYYTGWSLGVTVPFYVSPWAGDQRGWRTHLPEGVARAHP